MTDALPQSIEDAIHAFGKAAVAEGYASADGDTDEAVMDLTAVEIKARLDLEALIVAEMQGLRARAETAEARLPKSDDETWQTVPKIPTERMLIGARNALRNLIDSVPETERVARWGLPGPRGYAIPTDEKHAARYRGMLANAPTPSTSLRDRLADRERKLTEVCRERDEWQARAEKAEKALKRIQWNGDREDGLRPRCPDCAFDEDMGHDTSCDIAAAFAKPEEPTP